MKLSDILSQGYYNGNVKYQHHVIPVVNGNATFNGVKFNVTKNGDVYDESGKHHGTIKNGTLIQ